MVHVGLLQTTTATKLSNLERHQVRPIKQTVGLIHNESYIMTPFN
jgi:hypothetical protein